MNENEQFCCVFEAKLKGNNVLYGAEMDGIDSDNPFDPAADDLNTFKFVELKTKVREDNQHQHRNFLRFKTLNWWCQSFLVKVYKLVVGIRNRAGIVEEIQEIPIRDIPKMARVSRWNRGEAVGGLYFSFLSEFLVASCGNAIL